MAGHSIAEDNVSLTTFLLLQDQRKARVLSNDLACHVFPVYGVSSLEVLQGFRIYKKQGTKM